jgi:hypothetical protein
VKNKQLQENDSCGNVVCMGDVQRPEKVNDTCMKIMDGVITIILQLEFSFIYRPLFAHNLK